MISNFQNTWPDPNADLDPDLDPILGLTCLFASPGLSVI